MPAVPSSPLPAVLEDLGVLPLDPAVPADASGLASLAAALAAVPDPRCARGVRHDVLSMLVIAACATLAGSKSYAAIAQWASVLGAAVLAALGVGGVVPCESTLRRCLQAVDPDQLDAALSAWLAARVRAAPVAVDSNGMDVPIAEQRRVLNVDGKSVRGSAPRADRAQRAVAARGGGRVHLVAAREVATGAVVGQVASEQQKGRGGEPAAARALVTDLAAAGLLAGAVLTADAAHTQIATAATLSAEGGHYLLPVKANQPTLLARCKKLAWGQVTVGDTTTCRGHGRTETRTIKVLGLDPCPDGRGPFFPGAAQVIKLIRTRAPLRGAARRQTVYAITSLGHDQAHPGLLGDWLRQHWGIENSLHWVRDVTFDEDRSQVRTGAGPRNLAALRNLAISALRLTGWDNIAAGLRDHAHRPLLPLTTYGLT